VRRLIERLAKLAKRYDALLPWLLLAVVGGSTLAALQVLVVRLIR
jgi:hypothetical protein